MRIFLGELHQKIMNPALMVHANKSLAFCLYDFHLNGVPVEKLAAAYRIPVHSIEEKIEAVRLCLNFQVQVGLGPWPRKVVAA
jgi:hypothetical protein